MSEYLHKIVDVLERIEREEGEKLAQTARLVAETIKNDGLIFVFGCGHSHLPGLDTFYRAGGLANVSAMLDTDLMLHNGAAKSSRMEKMSGIASEVFRRYVPTEKDMIFIFSASGKNQVPIEMAQAAKALVYLHSRMREKAVDCTNSLISPLIVKSLTAMLVWK